MIFVKLSIILDWQNLQHIRLIFTIQMTMAPSEMLQNLSAHIPRLSKLLTEIEQVTQSGAMYKDQPAAYDVIFPLLCSYLTYWWQLGPEGGNKPTLVVTKLLTVVVCGEHNFIDLQGCAR